MKKKIYEAPEAVILSVHKDDIITSSSGPFNGEEEVFQTEVE